MHAQAQSLGGLRGDLLKTMLDNDSDLEGGEDDEDDEGEGGGRERYLVQGGEGAREGRREGRLAF